ncbi:exodeoxyribonuclease I [Psychromonas sp. SP041]|uniref:exodeoxyribonuclease I n=1 Tax=Psychromonas sp. SP041 TaxID=1365007 RepID=UPI0010C7B988|nr:exodeoxyribonuclease I [Psychromonas sp. SP041]
MRIIDSITWYDSETTGISKSLDQILQFASIKTDKDLNIIPGTETNIMCKPRPDIVPHPKAFLTHHLDMDILKSAGMNEFMLARTVGNIFSSNSNNGIAGYNTESFDNEMVRNLFFRNMKDLYEHEWKDGNFKFDLFPLVQMTYAFRPEILQWQNKNDGSTSLKLEHLAESNGVIHQNAHDALSDVEATIGLAKIIKESNPKLFEYAMRMTDKREISTLFHARNPLLHVNTLYGQDHNLMTPIMPMAIDLDNKNKYINLDLRHDPSIILDLSDEDIKKFMYTKRDELPQDAPKIPIVNIQSNKQPNIVDLNSFVKNGEVIEKARIDLDKVNQNVAFINANKQELIKRLQSSMRSEPNNEHRDPYKSIYTSGFIHKDDQVSRAQLHYKGSRDMNDQSLVIEKCSVHSTSVNMRDSVRHHELILRAKWNSFYEKLLTEDFSPTELCEYTSYLNHALFEGLGDVLTIPEYREEIKKVEMEMSLTDDQQIILSKLTKHVDSLEKLSISLNELAKTIYSKSDNEMDLNPDINKIRALIRTELYKDEHECESNTVSC